MTPSTVSRRAVVDRLALVDELLADVEKIRSALGAWVAAHPERIRP